MALNPPRSYLAGHSTPTPLASRPRARARPRLFPLQLAASSTAVQPTAGVLRSVSATADSRQPVPCPAASEESFAEGFTLGQHQRQRSDEDEAHEQLCAATVWMWKVALFWPTAIAVALAATSYFWVARVLQGAAWYMGMYSLLAGLTASLIVWTWTGIGALARRSVDISRTMKVAARTEAKLEILEGQLRSLCAAVKRIEAKLSSPLLLARP